MVKKEKRRNVFDTDIPGPQPKEPESLVENNILLFTSWSAWSQCSTCNEPGKRRKIGICTIKKLETDKPLQPVDIKMLANYPDGIPCRSTIMPKYYANVLKIQSRKSETLIGNCKVPCPTVPSVTNITDENGIVIESVKTGEGKYSLRLPPPSIPPMVKRQTVYETAGKNIELICPGSDSTTGVTWQNNTEVIDPIKVRRSTRARIIIDANVLKLRHLRESDSSLYSCWIKQRLVATVRIIVTPRKSNKPKDYLALAGIGASIITVVCICCTVCKNRKKQTAK